MNNINQRPSRALSNLSQILLCTVAFAIMSSRNIQAQCGGTVIVENESVSASKGKCGFTECQPSTPPKWYLVSETIVAKKYSSNSIEDCWDPYTFFPVHDEGEMHATTTVVCDRFTCNKVTRFSGSLNEVYFSGDPGYVTITSSITNEATGAWSGANDLSGSLEQWCADSGSPGNTTPICTSTASGSSWNGSLSLGSSWGCTSNSFLNGTYSDKHVTLLSDEYTDSDLRSDMISLIPPYPADPNVWGPGSGRAFYHMAANHESCSGGRMKYRFFLCGQTTSKKGQSYNIKWKEITTFDNGQPPKYEPKSSTVTMNGDPNGMYVYPDPVDIPQAQCSITESAAILVPLSTGE